FVCYNPPVVNRELGIRAPYLGEAAKLAVRFLREKIATIIFAQSRLATEVLLTAIKSGVADRTGDSGIVRGYRGGYLPTRRRAVEKGLREGEVLGVVSTNALELGVDIGHLDVAVLAGYPGGISSLWQQAGRHWHWAAETYPADHVSLRTVTTDNFLVIDTTARDEKQTKRRQIIAEVDWGSAFATIYPKAIYLVESEPYEVQELHFREDEEKVAYVKRVAVDYFTDAVSAKGVWILQRLAEAPPAPYLAEQGEVLVAEKVVGFKKIKMGTLENVGSGEVELPQQEMQTTAAWITVGPDTLARVGSSREELIDGLRAVTYLLHHLAPIFLL